MDGSKITGMVLAGGSGKRLRPITKNIPKTLVEISEGRCILDNLLDSFYKFGVKKVVLLIGYKGDKIKERYGSLWKDIEIEYSEEDALLGTFGAVRNAVLNKNITGGVILTNGDIITDLDLSKMVDGAEYNVTVLVMPMR
ncbi:nucleotidyl transferase, partial [mine drainage metagenome]